VLVAVIELKQIHHGQQLVSTQMHIVGVQHTTMATCMLFQTTQGGQQRQVIVIVTYKKCIKVLHQLLAELVRKVLENVGYVVVTLVYHTELVDKAQ
jgi:hypothetical protein